MKGTKEAAAIAVFTALIVGSDLVLSSPEFSNIKLMDTLVFVSAYVFGFRVGAAVGVLSEGIWSFLAPVGAAGAVAPFLVLGELIFAAAGWGASRAWKNRVTFRSPYPVFVGGLLAICAFLWDAETNAATALIAFWPGLTEAKLLFTMFNPLTLVFALAHEGSDFFLGLLLAPAFILVATRALGGSR